MVLIAIVTGANLNQRSHHWGGATLYFQYVQHNETEKAWQAMGIFMKQPRDITIIIHRPARLPKGEQNSILHRTVVCCSHVQWSNNV